eukprot:4555633-Prymnesium_polylepis.1
MPAAFVLRGESRAETEGWLEDLSQVAGHRGPACDRWYRKWLESVGRASDRRLSPIKIEVSSERKQTLGNQVT